MKFFSKYIFPPVYGLLTYAAIRLLTDSASGFKFWMRPWKLNLMEVCFSIFVSYLVIGAFRRLFRWFDTRWEAELSYSRIYTEVFYVFIVNLLNRRQIVLLALVSKRRVRMGHLLQRYLSRP